IIVGAPTYSANIPNRAGPMQSTDVRSRVPLGDGRGAIDMTTGRLERGDGRPIGGELTPIKTDDRGRPLRPLDPDKVTTGVKPDHIVAEKGAGPRLPGPLQPRQRPNQEPDRATDQVLQEAIRLLRQSLERFI